MNKKYDIIIAGGGPAGLTAAKEASSKGADVLLLELKAQIGQNKTSAWIPPNFLEKNNIQTKTQQINKVNIHSPNKQIKITGNFGKIINQEKLDKKLALEAAKSGTEIWVSTPVTDLLKRNETIKGIKAESGDWSEKIESKIVIDATGAKTQWSSLFLRKILKSNWNPEKILQTNEYLMTEAPNKNEVDLYFTSLLAPGGHSWIHPIKEELAITGISGFRIHPDSALDEFIGRKNPEKLQNSTPIGAYRGQIPLEGPLDETVSEGIIAAGSSAGQVYPLSGQGLPYALKSGRIAGEVASDSVFDGDVSETRLSRYESRWRGAFGKDIKAGSVLHECLEMAPDRKMDALLDVLAGDSELQACFVNLFLGNDVKSSLKKFFNDKRCKRIFGKKKIDELLSLY